MFCENCGKNTATTHIKHTLNGVMSEKHLCTECAAKLGYSMKFADSFSDILSSMFGDTEIAQIGNEIKCEFCGASFSDIVNTGKIGCPECYTTFLDKLLPYLKRIHGNVKHIGKIPNNAPLAISNDKTRIISLRSELEKLIQNEEFEKAAKVRDEIRELERKGEDNE